MTIEKKAQSKGRRGGKERFEKQDREYDQEVIDIARVTRVMAGGKRMSFRAGVAIGNKNGKIGFAIAKGADVMLAVNKAVAQAKKKMVTFPTRNETIPYEVFIKFKAANVLLKPAPKGTGVKAGGAVRKVLELAGVGNVTGKILGSNNKLNNSIATIMALDELNDIQRKVHGSKKK